MNLIFINSSVLCLDVDRQTSIDQSLKDRQTGLVICNDGGNEI
jgi:hypothetical protein